MAAFIREFKVLALPAQPVADAKYFVKKAGYVEEWITDEAGVAIQVGGGAGQPRPSAFAGVHDRRA